MKVEKTAIEGLLLITLDVNGDERGNFREVWQAEKMEALGLPHIMPVQMNAARSERGVTRGIHAEPWDKCVHVAYGKIFAAIVELRDNDNFGTVATFELDETQALFIPEGLGNSYQVLSDVAVYTYLVTDHWSAEATYTMVAYNDPDLAIAWPLPESERIVSQKDQNHRRLKEAFPNR